MATDNNMALSLNLEDPEGTTPVLNAHCVLTEVHLNYESQAVIGIFKCWRSLAAFEAKRKAFNTIQVVLPPKEGGIDFFARQGIDGAKGELGPSLINFFVERGELAPNKILNPDFKPTNG